MEIDGLVRRLLRMVAFSDDGCRLGPIVAVYLDVDTDRAEWAGVQVDQASRSERCVPLVRARTEADSRLVVHLGRRAVVESPAVPGRDLSRHDEDEMFRYYAQAISGIVWDDPVGTHSLTGDGPIRLRRLTRRDLLARTHLRVVSTA